MGINAVEVGAEEIVVDKENKIVTTPAYVDAKSMNESFTGIEKLVNKVLELI
jgi:enhancing lycopene biosynthesis protein 2